MVNRERAVDYLNSLDKVLINAFPTTLITLSLSLISSGILEGQYFCCQTPVKDVSRPLDVACGLTILTAGILSTKKKKKETAGFDRYNLGQQIEPKKKSCRVYSDSQTLRQQVLETFAL